MDAVGGGLEALSEKLKPLATAVSISDVDDPKHPLLSVNDAFCKITGYAAHEVVGKNCRFLQGGGTNPDAVIDLRTSVETRCGVASCLLNYRKNGEPFHNLVILSYYTSPSGRNIGMGCQYELKLDRFEPCVSAHLESVQGLVDSMSSFGSRPFADTLEALFMRSDSVRSLFQAYVKLVGV